MTNKLIPWLEIYQQPALFHIYLTERKRGKTDNKAWTFLENITTNSNKYVWLRRHWHDSLECSKPYWQDLVYKFCEEKEIKNNQFEVQEQGLFYLGKRRIYFFDLFSFRKARGKIARGTEFQEIVYEEAIPIDQEFLPREQFNFRDLVDSLKRKDRPLKITFLANPYNWSSWFLSVFEQEDLLFALRQQAEQLKDQKKNEGVKVWSKDKQWFLYINLVKPKEEVHSLALEETTNPFNRNWDEFMIPKPKKYAIVYAIADYFFCELGERKVHKKYALMHFTRNRKETNKDLVNFCFALEEKAKSKLKNCRIRKKEELLSKWVNMLKENILFFADYRARDWFLGLIKTG